MTKHEHERGNKRRPPSEGLKDLMLQPPHIRAGLAKAMAHYAISGSKNRMVQALAHELINAINDYDPTRFMERAGLAFRGGSSIRSSDKLAWRDRQLARLAQKEPYCNLPPEKAALRMIRDFNVYRSRRWELDLEEERPPQAGADMVWHAMLLREVKMPGTDRYVHKIIEKSNGVSGFSKK